MNSFTAHVEGIAFWAPTLPGWALARAALRGEAVPAMPPRPVCAPAALSAAERRRAPQTVALALTASEEAVRDAGRDASITSILRSAFKTQTRALESSRCNNICFENK